MTTPEDMAGIIAATGGESDRTWLSRMVVDHEGAIDMAEVQQEAGSDHDALALAEQIAADQTAEIELMSGPLAR